MGIAIENSTIAFEAFAFEALLTTLSLQSIRHLRQ